MPVSRSVSTSLPPSMPAQWQQLISDISQFHCFIILPSVLWCCWLGGKKGIRPVKNWVVGCWRGCLERGTDLHMAQLLPLPLTVSGFSKIQIGFTYLVPTHPGSRGQRAVKWVCVSLFRNWIFHTAPTDDNPSGYHYCGTAQCLCNACAYHG